MLASELPQGKARSNLLLHSLFISITIESRLDGLFYSIQNKTFPPLTHKACNIPNITQVFPTSVWVKWEMFLKRMKRLRPWRSDSGGRAKQDARAEEQLSRVTHFEVVWVYTQLIIGKIMLEIQKRGSIKTAPFVCTVSR